MSTKQTEMDWGDLDDLNAKPTTVQAPEESIAAWKEKGSASSQGAIYIEPCADCRGSGNFVSWAGRIVGPCFHCKGEGKRKFKTSPEQRAKERQRAADKVLMRKAAIKQQSEEFTVAHPEEVAFLVANANWSGFFAELLTCLYNYGHLTSGQITVVQSSMEKLKERHAVQQRKLAEAPVVSAVIAAFDKAQANGLKRPRLIVRDLTLSLAPPTGANAGHVYVKQGEDYLGKITPAGKFVPVRSCSQEAIAQVALLSENVLEQAVAHGKQTGQCSCCGRKLENALSVELGIGPICRDKWGL